MSSTSSTSKCTFGGTLSQVRITGISTLHQTLPSWLYRTQVVANLDTLSASCLYELTKAQTDHFRVGKLIAYIHGPYARATPDIQNAQRFILRKLGAMQFVVQKHQAKMMAQIQTVLFTFVIGEIVRWRT